MFHLFKADSEYSGEPYAGEETKGKKAIARTLKKALALADKLERAKPVGWAVYDVKGKVAAPGQCIYIIRREKANA